MCLAAFVTLIMFVKWMDIGVACIWVVTVSNVGPGPTCLTAFCGFPHSAQLKDITLNFLISCRNSRVNSKNASVSECRA